jgi:hypothetical protein
VEQNLSVSSTVGMTKHLRTGWSFFGTPWAPERALGRNTVQVAATNSAALQIEKTVVLQGLFAREQRRMYVFTMPCER